MEYNAFCICVRMPNFSMKRSDIAFFMEINKECPWTTY